MSNSAPTSPASIADRGATRSGTYPKTPATIPALVADAGLVRVGAGLKTR